MWGKQARILMKNFDLGDVFQVTGKCMWLPRELYELELETMIVDNLELEENQK